MGGGGPLNIVGYNRGLGVKKVEDPSTKGTLVLMNCYMTCFVHFYYILLSALALGVQQKITKTLHRTAK